MEKHPKYITYKGRIVFGKQSMPYFNRLPKEYAENEACFVLINKGEVSVRAQEDHFNLDKRSAVLAKCLNYFFETTKKQRQKGDEVEVIAVLLYPAVVEEIFNFDLSTSNYVFDYNIKQVILDKLLTNYMESIRILLDNPELADENIIETKLKEFVLLMTKSQNIPSQLDFLSGLFSPINTSFKSTINHNLYANLSLDELAHLCHMSISSFKRKFKEVFGESPKKFITAKKIEKAAKLLKSSDYRISDIAWDVGFESVATFNRNFMTAFGKSPTDFRLS